MTEKRLWTTQEDELLKFLRQERGLTKWSQIAHQMKMRFGRRGRNQKQCRDRFVNYLSIEPTNASWGPEEEAKLIELHKQKGNKWALLSESFPGTSENFIKNQFYSRLRKSVRKLNRIIGESLKKDFKKFKLSIIFKVSSIIDGKHKKDGEIPEGLSNWLRQFLYIFIDYSSTQEEQVNHVRDQVAFTQSLSLCLRSIEKFCTFLAKKAHFHIKAKQRFRGDGIGLSQGAISKEPQVSQIFHEKLQLLLRDIHIHVEDLFQAFGYLRQGLIEAAEVNLRKNFSEVTQREKRFIIEKKQSSVSDQNDQIAEKKSEKRDDNSLMLKDQDFNLTKKEQLHLEQEHSQINRLVYQEAPANSHEPREHDLSEMSARNFFEEWGLNSY